MSVPPLDALPELTPESRERHGRQLLLPEVGETGQRCLAAARVLVVGAGGLGSPAALYLAAAGVGHLTLVDHDAVELSNLQRQVLHGTSDVGRAKVLSGRDRLRALDPAVEVEAVQARLDRGNAFALAARHDLAIGATDDLDSRYVLSDACVLAGLPNVYASVRRFEGQASVLCTRGGPCYRCLFPRSAEPLPVPSLTEKGLLGVLPGLLGLVQATEALKLLLGLGEPLVGRLLLFDALRLELRSVRVRRDPACSSCGARAPRTPPGAADPASGVEPSSA